MPPGAAPCAGRPQAAEPYTAATPSTDDTMPTTDALAAFAANHHKLNDPRAELSTLDRLTWWNMGFVELVGIGDDKRTWRVTALGWSMLAATTPAECERAAAKARDALTFRLAGTDARQSDDEPPAAAP